MAIAELHQEPTLPVVYGQMAVARSPDAPARRLDCLDDLVSSLLHPTRIGAKHSGL
jgi:hypothetical protein